MGEEEGDGGGGDDDDDDGGDDFEDGRSQHWSPFGASSRPGSSWPLLRPFACVWRPFGG